MAHPHVENTISPQYLCFRLAGEECAIGILRVREIIEYDTVTRVPAMPPWVRGVMNLRGGVVPVIDLTVKFGLPESPVTKRSCIVIVEVALDGEPAVMGIVVDAVSQVLELSAADIEPPPAFGTAVRVDYLLGLGKFGDRFVLLLDIDRVLSAAELLKAASLESQEAGPAGDGIATPQGTEAGRKTRGAADPANVRA